MMMMVVIMMMTPSPLTCEVQRPAGGADVSPAGRRADGAAAGGAPLQEQAVVSAAQQLIFPQGELVPRQQLAAAQRAAKALDVVDGVPGAHHQVAAAEAQVALGAFYTEQPAERRNKQRHNNKNNNLCYSEGLHNQTGIHMHPYACISLARVYAFIYCNMSLFLCSHMHGYKIYSVLV